MRASQLLMAHKYRPTVRGNLFNVGRASPGAGAPQNAVRDRPVARMQICEQAFTRLLHSTLAPAPCSR
jgi:hypothetical protein